MRILFTIISFVFANTFIISGHSLPQNVEDITELSFMSKRFVNLGNMKSGETIKQEFLIQNTGNVDLIISNYKISCNCGQVTMPKSIKPGETDKITVDINTENKHGKNIITVLFEANTSQKDYIIRIDINFIDS